MPQTKSTAREATTAQRCPLCDRDHFCFLIGDPVERVICQWTDPNNPPQGWNYTGESKDHRPMFATAKRRHKSRKYPDLVTLSPGEPPTEVPEWERVEQATALEIGDIIYHKLTQRFYEVKGRQGRRMGGQQRLLLKVAEVGKTTTTELLEEECELATYDPSNGAELQQISYPYRDPISNLLQLRVVRRQWSDRRQWLEKFRKTKEVRPYHWDGETWQQGRGENPWPLYREVEAKEAILAGGIVFAVAGEQAVEVYRSLGLVACSCAGGENRWEDFADRLQDAFATAKAHKKTPLLVIHPDFDLAGENTFGRDLVNECDDREIPAIAINPQDVWATIGHGGDIKDVVEHSGMSPAEIIKALEHAIDEALNYAIKQVELRKQRDRWGAPDSHHGELGYWRKESEVHSYFSPMTNFDFQVEKEVASPEGGGFVLQLKRSGEHRQFRVYLPSLDFTSVQTFENTLKKALGGVLICRLNTNQMKALLRVRLHEYTHTRGGRVYRLCQRVGQQPDGHWVFPRCQLTPGGEPTDENKSLWIWNTGLTGDENTLPKPAIAPPDPEALPKLVEAMGRCYGPKNIYCGLIALGYGAASIHYQTIMEESGSFPILNLIGDAGSGKTESAASALALVGMHTEAAGGIMRDMSVSAAYERLKITGSLLHCLDDPERTPELDEFLKGLYNGKARVVRGQNGASFNQQKPHSPLMVTSNFACGETNSATMSRLLQLWSDNTEPYSKESEHWEALTAARHQASGALPDLIKLGYPKEEIADVERDLLQHLPHAHSRVARSLALIVWYTEAVCRLARVKRFDVRAYAIDTVCAMANDVDNSADSLRDFVERLFILRSQARVGEWNMRFIRKHNSDELKSLALNLPSIWTTLDAAFKLPYNLRIIKHLMQSRGADMQSRQKFHIDEDVSKAYHRGSTNNPKWQIKRCVEVPIEVIRAYVEMDAASAGDDPDDMSTVATEPVDQPKSLSTSPSGQLTSNCSLNVNLKEECQLNKESSSQLPENPLTTENAVDMCMSTGSAHVQQGVDPVIEGQLPQLTSKMCAHSRVLMRGDRVRIIKAGSLSGQECQVEEIKGDVVVVGREGWAIKREYAPHELELLQEVGHG